MYVEYVEYVKYVKYVIYLENTPWLDVEYEYD